MAVWTTLPAPAGASGQVDHSQVEKQLRAVARDLMKPYSPAKLAQFYPLANIAHVMARNAIAAAAPKTFTYAGRHYGIKVLDGGADTEVYFLLTADEVTARVGMSRAAMNAAIRNGAFPSPYTGHYGRPRLWRASDVHDFELGIFESYGDASLEGND